MAPDLIYQLALTMIPQIGPVQAKILLQHCDPEEIFHAKKHFLEKIEGIGPVRAQSIKEFRDFSRAEKEIRFIEKHEITPLFLAAENYPKRLLNCFDPPTLLYFKGIADLNAPKIISIIGTRNHSDYARLVIEKLVTDLQTSGIMIISGMAYGVDALAHKAALNHRIPTIAVLAHGLDHLYPPEHKGLAKDILKEGGGLLTEFCSGTKPDKHHFPSRNRIVAGISDAVIVVETDTRGGSMITAELANGYNRDVFAVPGRLFEKKSAGCNYLIRTNRAQLLESAQGLLETMGWQENPKPVRKKPAQQELFIELSSDERVITGLLMEKDTVHIDELNQRSGISSSAVAAAILNLELRNVIVSLPGKIFKLQ